MLTRDAILSAPAGATQLRRELVSVPEWGGDVYVRELTGRERDEFEAGLQEGKGRKQRVSLANVRARLAALAVCDDHGKRLFTDADVDALGERSAAALDRIFDVASRLSGLTQRDVEDLTKN